MLATYFVYIPSHSGITAIFSAAALQSKKGKGQKKKLLSVFFFCRCCYSCKQKSRHPIIPVGERERERQDPRQPPPLPSPPKKKKQNLARISSIKSMDCCESTPLQPTGTFTVLHTRRCSVFPKLYPIPKLFSFCLFLSFCPALPPPIRNSASQDPLRACVSCLSCLVSFSPPGRATTLFHSFSRYRHQSITKPTVS